MQPNAPCKTKAPNRLPRCGRLVYVVLLALAWLQVSFASHQFEHAVGDLSDSCAVCSHFDRLEHSVAPDIGLPELPATSPLFVSRLSASADAKIVRAFFPRGPPLV